MNDKEKEILQKYNEIKPHLQQWGRGVDSALSELLCEPFFDSERVKIRNNYRVKDDKSYLYKVLYRNKNYDNPVLNIEDKIGTRIVLLTSEDVEKAANIILSAKDKWIAKTAKNLKDMVEENPEVFSYQSIHIIVSPNDDGSFSSELNPILTCEIQIRTLLQHAYAEISHDSAYKGPYKNDKEIVRHLAKSMALMEATDDYFCKIFSLMTDQKRKYALLLQEIIKMYNSFNDSPESSSVDYETTDLILTLIEKQDVQVSEIEAFSIKEKEHLKRAITNNKGLFEQPIILLIAYYFFRYRSVLNSNWPLTEYALKSVYKGFNVSYNNY